MKCEFDFTRNSVIINNIPFAFESIEDRGWAVADLQYWAEEPQRAWVIREIFHILARDTITF